MAAAAGVLIMTSADNEEPNLEPVQKKKKMTPKEYRQMKPKPKTNPSITLSDKKNFKEGFNTDKSRLMKRKNLKIIYFLLKTMFTPLALDLKQLER